MDEQHNDELSPDSQVVWAGELEKNFWQRATQLPLVHSVSFGYADVDEWLDVALQRKAGHIDGRNTNPTVAVFEDKVRQLEGAEAATSFATGMAAISNTLFALLAPGSRVVSVKDTYGGTNQLFINFLPRWNVHVTLVDTANHDAIEAATRAGCDLLYLETPTNPTLKVLDLSRLTAAAKRVGATVVVDNTFATPINTQSAGIRSGSGAAQCHRSSSAATPTRWVASSVDQAAWCERIYHYREITGATLDPTAAYLLLRGMKTLHLRVRQQNESALKSRAFSRVIRSCATSTTRGSSPTRVMPRPRGRCAVLGECSASLSRATSRR